ncbi:MAG: ABC transporter permease [bacterium]|nr:ABC transporter permease [bacterium]
MKSRKGGAPYAVSAEEEPFRPRAFRRKLTRFLSKTLAIVEVDIRKLRHDYMEVITRACQPALWLLVFGGVFGRLRSIPSDDLSYRAFLAPGVLAQSVLFIAIFCGISIIWERDLGIVHKLLVSPTPRSAIVLGKGLAAGIRGLAQCFIIYLVASFLQIPINWSPFTLLGVVMLVVLGAVLFSTFSLGIACIVKTRERFMGIGQLLTMPVFLISNAIYPIAVMPGWMRALARFNPLSYEVDALRALMPVGGTSHFGLGVDFAVLAAVTTLLVIAGSRLYPRVAM